MGLTASAFINARLVLEWDHPGPRGSSCVRGLLGSCSYVRSTLWHRESLLFVLRHFTLTVEFIQKKIRFLAMPRSGYQSLESRPWSSIVLTIGASVALGVCAGVAYSTYELIENQIPKPDPLIFPSKRSRIKMAIILIGTAFSFCSEWLVSLDPRPADQWQGWVSSSRSPVPSAAGSRG